MSRCLISPWGSGAGAVAVTPAAYGAPMDAQRQAGAEAEQGGSAARPPAPPERAGELLGALAGPDARLRADQAAAIEAVAGARRRALVVQRTGFGKSAIYFIATRLLRDAGAGPTL